jgi:DNA repair photolyase
MPQDIQVKSVLNKTKRRDPWFLDDYTANPYSGCSFNCLYCYIRGSKYGTNMEEKTSIKTNALHVFEKQLSLRARMGQYGVVVLSSATDPYLHFEKETKLTRGLLEILLKYRFPVHVITKSDLVTRDFDLLKQIDSAAILPADLQPKLKRGVILTFSFSTLDQQVADLFEPGATAVEKRLATLKTVVDQGFKTGVSLMPLLPYISDTGENLEFMFGTFKRAGAHYLLPASITLFGNNTSDSKTLVLRAIEKHYPHLLEKYKRFFHERNEMPDYYTKALSNKTKELSNKYGLKNTLLDPTL